MMTLFRKYSRLRAIDQWLFVQMAVFLPLIELSLRTLGFKGTVKLLHIFNKPRVRCSSDTIKQVTRHRKMLKRVCRYMPLTGRCLSQSLVLWALLSRQSIEIKLHFGQKIGQNNQQRFKAHAWLEYDGLPINANKHIRQHYKTFEQSMITNACEKT